MQKLTILSLAAIALATSAPACKSQKEEATAGEKTFVFQGNPLIRDNWTADPAPMVASDGRLYLYVGHDEYYDGQDQAGGGKEFNITEWLCYSTDDMVHWTDHGSVLRPSHFAWGDTINPGVGTAWASQVVEKDGKFYYYTTLQGSGDNSGYAVGVAVADSPVGPFVDAIGAPLVSDKMTDNGQRGWWNDIDPTVLIDGDEAWLCWGNGTCFLAKLGADMVSLDGDIQTVDVPRYIEGPWLSKRGDTYYLTYASMGDREKGDRGEAIDYATAPSMQGPWTPQGQVTGSAPNSFTIHPGLISYKGKNYLFYHNGVLQIDSIKGAIGRRSVCFDEMTYAPDGTINYVNQTLGEGY